MSDERFETVREAMDPNGHADPNAPDLQALASIQAELAETRRERDEFRELLLDKGMKVGTATTAALQARITELEGLLREVEQSFSVTQGPLGGPFRRVSRTGAPPVIDRVRQALIKQGESE